VKLYWLIFLLLLLLSDAVGLWWALSEAKELSLVLRVTVTFLPAPLLAAAILTFFILVPFAHRDEGKELARLGKIVLGVFIGTGIGLLLSGGCFVLGFL
jgi:hypothetical protein